MRCRVHLGLIQQPVPGGDFGKMKPSKQFCSSESKEQRKPLNSSSAPLAPALCIFQLPSQSRSSNSLPGGCSSYTGRKAMHGYAQLPMAFRPPQSHAALQFLVLLTQPCPCQVPESYLNLLMWIGEKTTLRAWQ